MPPASMTTRKANRSRFLWGHELCRISSIAAIANGGIEYVDRRQGIEKHDCRFAAEAVRDGLVYPS